MTDRARQIIEQALLLSIDERAQIAAELLHSLDQGAGDVESRWGEAITRRAQRAIAGESVGQDAQTVLSSIETKLRR